ncbi:hypothetical protein HYW53_01585 [Candidatus Giovannonibacteria bacterium]|nr:hypothetical protein [Candidatus Giovannonibacteria bacterium]
MKKFFKKFKTGEGFSILETLIAITILIAALTGPLALASQSIRSAYRARNETIATYLTAEAFEFIRNKRDTNTFQGVDWMTGISNLCAPPDGCYVDSYGNEGSSYQGIITSCTSGNCPEIKWDASSGLYGYSSGENSGFKRKVVVTNIADHTSPPDGLFDEVKVEVTISWTEFLQTPSFTVQTNLFKWH